MTKRNKIILSVIAGIIIICAVVFTIISYTATSKIAKKIEQQYNDASSFFSMVGITSDELKCSGGMSVNCKMNKLSVEDLTFENINFKLKGSKYRAKISTGLKVTVNDKDSKYYKYNDTVISCEYDNKLDSKNGVITSDLKCNVDDKLKNKYAFNSSVDHKGELLKNTNFMQLEEKIGGETGLMYGLDIDSYLNDIEVTAILKDLNNNFFDDMFLDSLNLRGGREKAAEMVKELKELKEYKESSDEIKKRVDFLYNVYANNHATIHYNVKAKEKDSIRVRDIFGFDRLKRSMKDFDDERGRFVYTLSSK